MMDTGNGFPGPVNLGNPVEFPIRQLAEEVLDLTGSRSRLVHQPLPQDDPRQRQPDISLARGKLNRKPRTQLRDGLAKTIAYCDALLGQREAVAAGRLRSSEIVRRVPVLAEPALHRPL